MPGLGTLINGLAVIGGGLLGLIFRKGLPQRFQITLMQALGLSSIFIGIAGALEKMLVIQASGICVHRAVQTLDIVQLDPQEANLLGLENRRSVFSWKNAVCSGRVTMRIFFCLSRKK